MAKYDNTKEKKPIALTFDDGPGEYTGRLLDLLTRYGAKATFLVVGESIDGREALLRRMAGEGHEIGNHTLTHRPLTYMTEEEVISEITSTAEKIKNAVGFSPAFVRAPYGDVNEKVQDIGASLGVSFAGWSLDTRDWESKCADSVYTEITSNVSAGDIILCHETHLSTIDAVEKVLPYLLDEGFELITLSCLLTDGNNTLEKGKIYYRR